MQAWPARRAWFQVVVALAAGGFAGLLVFIRLGWLAAAIAGPLAAAAVYWLGMRRYLRRRRLIRQPFPEAWREPLNSCVRFYKGRDAEGRERFENDVRFFLAEQRIYGPRGAPVDDRTRVEVFFEKPDQLKEREPELYGMLAGFFNQDPAGANQRPG